MSGHSKWSTIKRKKGAADAKRGQIFTKLAREIVMAAREGGGDPNANFRLRLAVDKARLQNMPKDSIDRAIKRGTGESKDGETFEQITYEGYGPNAVALMIECFTENRNRTVAELRHVLSRSGGSLGESGSVAWQFDRVSFFEIPAEGVDFDKIFEIAVEGGADDVTMEDDLIEVIAPVESFKALSILLDKQGIKFNEAGLKMVPKQELTLGVEDTLQVMRTIEAVEDLDDVQNVYSNMRISEEAMAALEED
ncbi:transcriptional regulator [Ornatilinea apprima]|uniref:Probable transcriptional regulatory protein ADN00_08160 n=1 Tax=Ornatilinea apprima TaxID=1134406 RepID=A0A0P6X7D3_9CHLR|nr:YebC/PmpR family DNA-binding transcriptional regulator [Ornatilinea apprima]KPL77847.1 transcriptional regulator [Ornatilinea apprima]